jgi:hypothetical protein
MCIEEVNEYHVVDIGCGGNFSVIITTKEETKERYNLIRDFNN